MPRPVDFTSALAVSGLILIAAALPAAADETWQPRNTQSSDQHPPSPLESLRQLHVPEGFQVTLAAAEPDVRQPIAVAFDDRGRLWVAESYSYDGSDFTEEHRDRILIFDDLDGDGVFDQRKVFCDRLNRLTGLAIGFGGVWVTTPPQVAFIADRDGDDRPDGEAVVHLDGWTLAAEHNSVNGLTWGPDGWLYGRHGIKQPSLVGRPGDSQEDRIHLSCCIWRYHPTRMTFEVVADGTVNPWGLDFDDRGQAFCSTSVVEHLWHVVPGARFSRRKGFDSHPNPYSYELMEPTSDHLHWGGSSFAKQDRVAPGNERFGGGHSHCDAMIYLGNGWPKKYRGSVFMSNIHGRRVNRDRFQRDGSGRLIATHEDDFLVSDDPWFRAVSIEYGPDGDVYVTDWSDLGECHDRDGIHRTSGRIYKITWGKPHREAVDLARETDRQLVELQLHENDWFVRHARRLLQERAASGKPMEHVHQLLDAMFLGQTDVTRKLRALWALHVTGGLNADWLISQLAAEDEEIRGWATRLLVDRRPVRGDLGEHFSRLARTESSWLVRMELASALGRLPVQQRLSVATALARDGSAVDDPNLLRMIWYGIEPAVAADSQNAIGLLKADLAPRIRRFVARRIGDQLDQSPATAEQLFSAMRTTESPEHLADILSGLNESLVQNRPRLQAESMHDVLAEWIAHPNPRVRRGAVTTAMILGNDALVDDVSELIHNLEIDQATRGAALEGLIARRPRRLAEDLLRLIQSDQFVSRALRAAPIVDDPRLIDTVLAKYDRFNQSQKRLAVDLTIARSTSATLLFDAIEEKRIPVRDVSADQARQILALKNKPLAERLTTVWGSLNSTPKVKRQQIASLKELLQPTFFLDADLKRGRTLFNERCAICHRLFGEGEEVAPELTGSGRRDLDYLLINIIDPNAAVAADFRVSVILLDDGRVITGTVISTTEQRLTVHNRTESVHIPRDEIDVLETTNISLMPEELLKGLTTNEVRDLFRYLMSDGPAQK